MTIRILVFTACLFGASIATAAANTNPETPRNVRYHYSCSGTSPGFSFLPFLGLKRIAPDSAVVKESRPARLPEECCEEVTSTPAVF